MTVVTHVSKSAVKTVNAYGLFVSDNKLLASDTDVALVASEMTQVPAFVHGYGVFASEDKLVASIATLP